ncbi:uncharacterized protein LTR77_003637 [Saxophila tyrrhenica]|uniref:Uncharacterized protein n=1 Tax=Saxophila tyrrhenica TaxID=1690608 RepID=A0AAV9PEV6_9PEZI|nr:hypothetical protein LTR77_003637 [Saxophila tyrrhenica]
MADEVHSTGRGGAGNIGHDSTVYTDGDIVREGVVGEPGHPGGGDYSSGRGGAGNVVPSPRATPVPEGTAHPPPAVVEAGSTDAIPEPAMRQQHPGYENFHTGRGGGGNVHKDKFGGHTSKREQEEAEERKADADKDKKGGGFMEKAKHAMGMDKKKEGETS